MTINEIKQLIANNENHTPELKKSTSELVKEMQTLCAFLITRKQRKVDRKVDRKQNIQLKLNDMEQIERIQYMEQLLDFVIEAQKEQNVNQEKSARIQEATCILAEYYASDEWKQDFTDNEAGLLPKNLKCGVLSEDGIWNVLDTQ